MACAHRNCPCRKNDVIGVDLRGEVERDDEQSRFFAEIQNSGPRDVTIIDMRFPGEPAPAGDEIREVTVPAGDTQVVDAPGFAAVPTNLPVAIGRGRPASLELD
jgi:hypothetical protein